MKVFYFSPTGNTKRACEFFAQGDKTDFVDFTNVAVRLSNDHIKAISEMFKSEDHVVIGLPVYAGRVPNVLLKYLSLYKGNKAKLTVILTYGNRHYDDAAKEAYHMFTSQGFTVLSVVCVVGEHSFSDTIASNKPNEKDHQTLKAIAENEALESLYKVKNLKVHPIETLSKDLELRDYFKPVDYDGNVYAFKTIKPITTEACNNCGICAIVCPMGSISDTNYSEIIGPCIKCCACVKHCTAHAKIFNDVNFLKHKLELEEAYCNIERDIEVYI